METNLPALLSEDSSKRTLVQLALINMPRGTHVEDAQRIIEKELMNLEMILQMRPELKVCTQVSMLQTVKQVINDNLSLAPSAGLVYLYPSNVCTGVNKATNAKEYATVMQYDPTANGRLSRARQAGRILDNKRPVPTFDANGKVTAITVEFLVPSYPTPRWDVQVFVEWNFKRWSDASARKNSGNAAGFYTSHNGGIDPEFAASKAIRHGLAKLGTNMNERTAISPGTANEYKPLNAASAMKEASDENGFTEHVEIESITNQPAISTNEMPDANLM